ncbi:uncharacterized protein PAC_17208 [Phialocephala subalpina]|uniref:GST N-terminal domain-containing protein n=1 Tax=Phialocephala subalpina TaxID=576137 RepID=A0A1L7XQM4_9HELO|nr:uncharacterized protein PAC_17208 [Phialocephala subalpina]
MSPCKHITPDARRNDSTRLREYSKQPNQQRHGSRNIRSTWGVYPRRVLIYLAEKGLLGSTGIKITPGTTTVTSMTAPGKPPGSVPFLSFGDGRYIKQSVTILEYFEDVCDAAEASQSDQKAPNVFERHVSGSMQAERPRRKQEFGKNNAPQCRPVGRRMGS